MRQQSGERSEAVAMATEPNLWAIASAFGLKLAGLECTSDVEMKGRICTGTRPGMSSLRPTSDRVAHDLDGREKPLNVVLDQSSEAPAQHVTRTPNS